MTITNFVRDTLHPSVKSRSVRLVAYKGTLFLVDVDDGTRADLFGSLEDMKAWRDTIQNIIDRREGHKP